MEVSQHRAGNPPFARRGEDLVLVGVVTVIVIAVAIAAAAADRLGAPG